jgi:EAL domain-containing protein (putative c-di-GMP-specific phosphodiesterase class I)
MQQALGAPCAEAVSFKAGVVPIGGKAHGARELIEKGLLAVREAKEKTEQSTVVYDQALDEAAARKKDIEVNMIHALSKGEFEVYIQPKITVADNTLYGGEALVRWQSDQMGFVMPDQFIPVFETNGFIVEIDFFMLTSVLVMLQNRLEQGESMAPISVNQSRITITHPNYLERLKRTLSAFSVPRKYIEIEVTESSFEKDNELFVSLVDSIKELGFPLDMDDFGAGYSSLNTLRRLPIDIIKIDREFLGEADTSYRSRMIIKSIIRMSHDLGIHVICEGVETEFQFDFLKESGCDSVQGYLFSKPIPMDDFISHYLDESKVWN